MIDFSRQSTVVQLGSSRLLAQLRVFVSPLRSPLHPPLERLIALDPMAFFWSSSGITSASSSPGAPSSAPTIRTLLVRTLTGKTLTISDLPTASSPTVRDVKTIIHTKEGAR